MAQSTEELNSDIEKTRRSLAEDVDELSDKVSPSRVVQRRKDAARSRLGSFREKVMGTASHGKESTLATGSAMTDSASSAAGAVQDTAQGAVSSIQDRTEGSPLTAGMVAFGVGMIISSLIPASRREAEATQRLKDSTKEQQQSLAEEAKSAGQEMGQQLKDSASEAAEQVKASAQGSAEHVKQESQGSAEQLKGEAQRRF